MLLKVLCNFPFHKEANFTKTLLIMKLIAIFLFAACLQVNAKGYSQKITLSQTNVSLKRIFREIENQSGYQFFYKDRLLKQTENVTVNVTGASVEDVLNICFKNQPLTYTIVDKIIVVKTKKVAVIARQTDAVLPPLPLLTNINGTIKDEKGNPLASVSVIVKGTKRGTSTSATGSFTIDANAGDVLEFSIVGYKKRSVTIGQELNILVVMEAEATIGNEVVVVGYGTQNKRGLTGSISTIKADRFSKVSGSSNFAELIQGQAAGVSVQSTSGVPGAESNIIIRGLSSISASVNPLWIIDGIPIITTSGLNNAGTTDQSPMSLINPNDIESIDILKDAAATSIYGSRGSNGVILVTTKSGKTGKPSVNVDYSMGESTLPFHKVDYVNTTQWFSILDAAGNANGIGPFQMTDHYAKIPYSKVFLTRDQAENINTDWFNETMRQGEFQNLNLSVVGGTDKSSYYISGNYRNDQSVMKGNDLQRYTVRSNIDLRPLPNVTVGVKMNLALSKNNRIKNSTDFESGNVSGTSGGFNFLNTNAMPWYPVYNPGSTTDYYSPQTGMNPVASIDRANLVDNVDMYRLLGGVYAEYAIPFVKGLRLRSELSLDFLQSNMNFWVSGILRENGSYASDQSLTQRNLNYNVYGTFQRSYGSHNINIVGGMEAQRSSGWNRLMQGQDLVGTYQELGTPNQRLFMSSGLSEENYLLAYFGRANYSFKDKYLAGVSLRSDGSSTFTSEHRWGTFAAFSAGWILSEESFMHWFGKNNFLKLRGSFGQTGNQNIPSNLNVTGYSGNNPFGSADLLSSNGTSITTIGVTNLSWETTDNADVGLDFGFMNNRVNGSFAYYHKLVKGLLLQAPVPLSVGLVGSNSIWENVGDLLNRGYEFNISSANISNHDFVWKTNFNISFNHNEVTKLLPALDKNGRGMVSGDEGQFITKKGYGINEFYLAKDAGVDPQTGFRMIYALDNDYYNKTGETRQLKDGNGADMKVVGTSDNIAGNLFHIKGKSSMPTYFGGLSNSFEYKGFDLNILAIYSGGNYILDFVKRRNVQPNFVGAIDKDLLGNYWTKPGDVAKYPRLDWYGSINLPDGTTVNSFDSRTRLDTWAYKGDFVKLKTITLGYRFSKAVCNRLRMQGIRISASVDNLFTITKYPGWDPEGLQYVTTYNLPQLLAGTIGLSIKF